MRRKVIPKRGLRLWEPVVWGFTLSIPMHFAFMHENYVGEVFAPYIVIFFIGTAIFPLVDALSHRSFWRIALRSLIYGLANSVSVTLLVSLDMPVFYVHSRETGYWLYYLWTSILIQSVTVLICAVSSWAILVVLAGRHLQRAETHSFNSREAHENAEGCSQCECEQADAVRGVWPAEQRLKRAMYSIVLILLGVQLVFSTRVVRDSIVPIERFAKAVPSQELMSITRHSPHPNNDSVDESDETRVYRLIDVQQIAAERQLPIDVLTVVLVLDHNGQPPVIEIAVGDESFTRSWGYQRGGKAQLSANLTWRMDAESAARFLNSDGLTTARLESLLDEIRPTDLINASWSRDINW